MLAQGFAPENIAIAGESAGGGLVVVATLVSLRDAGESLPACASLSSPWVDPAMTGGSMIEGGGRPADQQALPDGAGRGLPERDRSAQPSRLTPLR